MQPAATEVERETRGIGDGPCPPAEPRARFDHQAIDAGRAQPPASRNAGGAAADDRDLGFAICHAGIVTRCQPFRVTVFAARGSSEKIGEGNRKRRAAR